MNSLTTKSPTCPRCHNDNTYDIIPELSNLLDPEAKESVNDTAYSYKNNKYYCIDCGYSWKKYKGRKPYEKIRMITAETGGFPGPFFTVKLDLISCTAESNSLMKYRFDNEKSFSRLTQEQIDCFREELYRSDLLNWAERYEDLTVLDGTHWNIRISYETYCETKSGSNHFPPGWTKFCRAVTRLSCKEFY